MDGWFCWRRCRCTWAASFLALGKVDAVGLKFLLGADQIVSSSLQGPKGGTFSCCRSMGLELLSEEADKWSVEGTSLCGFVWYVVAVGGVQGFCNGVEVKPLVLNLLE